MLSFSQAQAQILHKINLGPVAYLPLAQATGCVLAESISSPTPVPPFDNSAMDGYALYLPPAFALPFTREVIQVVAAGQTHDDVVSPTQAVKIMTGAALPPGANAVVPIEEVKVLDAHTIEIQAARAQGQHIRKTGEEIKQGQQVLAPGQVLNPGAIGVLATLGFSQAQVYRPLKVAILTTGSELLPVEAELEPGKIRDSNSHALAAAVREAGADPILYGIIPDQRAALSQAFAQATSECDVILSLGGVSVGDFDYVQDVLLEQGFEKVFWKVAMRPGKPLLFGTLQHKPVFGIPGNPGSALTVFQLLVRPALKQMMGHSQIFLPQVQARLRTAVRGAGDRLHFQRASATQTDQCWEVEPLKAQGSSNLLIVAQANALVEIERNYAAHETVRVHLLT